MVESTTILQRTLLLVVILLHPFTTGAQMAKEKRSQKVVIGDFVELECVAGDGMLSENDHKNLKRLIWTKEGATVASFNKASSSAEWWVAGPRYVLDRFSFKLAIHNVQLEDAGPFRCVPEFRKETRTARLKPDLDAIIINVIGPPSAPGKAIVSSYTSRTATVSWEASKSHSDDPVIQYIVVVSVGKYPERQDVFKEIFSVGNRTSKQIPSLTPFTVYTFTVLAENLAGRSAPGEPSLPIRTKGEAPSAAPKIKYAYNATNASIVLTWEHPAIHTLYGPLVGYRIIVRSPNTRTFRKEFYVNKPDINSYEITGLKVYSNYVISLEADNTYGYSPAAMVNVLTEEGVPSTSPIISNVAVKSSKSLEITWIPPNITNGQIVTYSVYYWAESKAAYLENPTYNLIQISPSSAPWASNSGSESVTNTFGRQVMKYSLQDLEPYSKYFIWITASTRKGESPPSEKSFAYTDTATPDAPVLVNISLKTSTSLLLEWSSPKTVYRQVDLYMIRLHEDKQISIFNATDTHMLLTGLSPGKKYFVSVRAVTQSILQHGMYYAGEYCNQEVFVMQEAKTILYTTLCPSNTEVVGNTVDNAHYTTLYCDNALRNNQSVAHMETAARNPSFLIFGSVGLLVVLILLSFILLMLWRKFYQKTIDTVDGSDTVFVTSSSDQDFYETPTHPAILLSEYKDHVRLLHADGDFGFAKEYETIDNMSIDADQYDKITCEASSLNENKAKNRYVNILPYDHSRVVLKNPDGISDYINANFVDGFCQKNAYIATQGPLPHTFADFWQMVWEQRCTVVVMITNLVERGRKKCDQYWPSENSETYGQFQVKMLNEYHTTHYSVRMFCLKNLKLKTRGDRVIHQYHYRDWPDHGVPSQPLPVLTFIKKSSATNRDTKAPVVVHCSAGVGRSGTYIVIDAMLKQIRAKSTVNIYGFLKHIRTQRNFLVQTEDQYIFCHDAILESIQSGDTEVAAGDLSMYIDEHLTLTIVDPIKGEISVLDKQFELIQKDGMSGRSVSVAEALKPCNIAKNRTKEILPADEYRVVVTPKPSEDCSDYINASFLQGYHKQEEFIVTQFPTVATYRKFWQLIWDYTCQTIVLLTRPDFEEFPKFWPETEEVPIDCGSFFVYSSEAAHSQHWSIVDFILQSTQDDFQLTCRMVLCPDWPYTTSSNDLVFDLVHAVQEWHFQYHNGPIVVVDKFGGSEAGIFCALSSLFGQLEQDNTVDVYQVAKLYNIRRPNIFATKDKFAFLYAALRVLVTSNQLSTYQTGLNRPNKPIDSLSHSVHSIGQLTTNRSTLPPSSRSRVSLCSPPLKVLPSAVNCQSVQLRSTAENPMESDTLSDEPEESDNVRLLSETYDVDKKGLRADRIAADGQNGFIRPMSYPIFTDLSVEKRLTTVLPSTGTTNDPNEQPYQIFCAVAQYRESLDGTPLVGPNIATTL